MMAKSYHSAPTASLVVKLQEVEIVLNPIFCTYAQLTSSHPFCLTIQILSTTRTLDGNTALLEISKKKK